MNLLNAHRFLIALAIALFLLIGSKSLGDARAGDSEALLSLGVAIAAVVGLTIYMWWIRPKD